MKEEDNIRPDLGDLQVREQLLASSRTIGTFAKKKTGKAGRESGGGKNDVRGKETTRITAHLSSAPVSLLATTKNRYANTGLS